MYMLSSAQPFYVFWLVHLIHLQLRASEMVLVVKNPSANTIEVVQLNSVTQLCLTLCKPMD